MTILLIANIGSSDVQLKRAISSDDLPDPKSGQERLRGIYFASHFDDLYDDLDLALLRKAVEHIDVRLIDQIVLFASDQEDEQHRGSDTIETAKIVSKLLQRRWNISPKTIQLESIQQNPADHDSMIQEQSNILQRLDAQFQPTTVYLEVTGGTPAMTNALLLAGTEVFQDRAVALYISRFSEMPGRLAVGKRLLAGPLRKVLQANLATFQYTAALDSWALYRPYFTDSASKGRADVMEGLIHHLAARINLDLPEARQAIIGLDAAAGGNYRQIIEPLYNALTPPSREKALAELLHVAEVRLEMRAFSEFLTQMVRFFENALRLMCLRLRVQFVNYDKQADDDGANVDQSWLKQRQLQSVKSGQAGLQKLLHQLAPNDPKVQSVLKMADTCEGLIRFRNKSTHNLSGVSATMVETAFGGPWSDILPLLDAVYATITDTPRLQNPYRTINAFLSTLLENR